MGAWLRDYKQPSLDEMLDDPMMQLLMQRDGVTREEVVALMRRRQAVPPPAETTAPVESFRSEPALAAGTEGGEAAPLGATLAPPCREAMPFY